MSDFAQCPRCVWRISTDEEGWEEALAAHQAAHEKEPDMKVCKICGQPAAATSGMYALLCTEHAAEKKQQRAPAMSNGHAMLADLGRAVDDARLALEQAVEKLRRELDG